jgi:peptidoglycan hydrolase-like protein with peptidoglycan-binding domain
MKKQKINEGKQDLKKGSRKKWLFIGLGVAATGALTYFGWQYWKNHRNQADAENDVPDFYEDRPVIPKPKTNASSSNDDFPLQKGSKGANVKALQQALITKYGKSILPKYGADGDFGTETINALKKSGLPESIDESTYNVLVKGSSPNYATTASQLYAAASSKDFNKALALLKTLRNTSDYKTVSDAFMNYRIGGVRQTLVNGMLNSFTNEQQKQSIRLAFSNMGLKYDGSKWSLSGFDTSRMLITKTASKVWKDPKTSVPVPANMVLGREITKRGSYSLFENDKQLFLVESQHVRYHK